MVLDDDTIDDHVDIPGYVRDRTRGDRTKFSDVLRIDLLARHGGVWLDATCLVRRNVLALRPELLTAGFFAPRSRRTRIASWFMASDPGGHVITALRSAQLAYWRAQLAGAAPALELPTDRQRPATASQRGDRERLGLDAGCSAKLKARSPEQGPGTLVHGDYRLDNMILSASG